MGASNVKKRYLFGLMARIDAALRKLRARILKALCCCCCCCCCAPRWPAEQLEAARSSSEVEQESWKAEAAAKQPCGEQCWGCCWVTGGEQHTPWVAAALWVHQPCITLPGSWNSM